MKRTNAIQFDAPLLRVVLSITMVLIIAATVVGFVFAYRFMASYAVEISHRKEDARVSNGSLQTLQTTEQTLSDNQMTIAKLTQLRANATEPNPKFTIVNEVQALARKNNVTITNFSYGSGDTTDQSSTPQAAPQAPAAEAPASGTPPASSSDIIALTANIRNPVNYRSYLQFLRDIEQNIPKMKVKAVSVSNGTVQDESGQVQEGEQQKAPAGSVNAQPLVIEMYVRSNS